MTDYFQHLTLNESIPPQSEEHEYLPMSIRITVGVLIIIILVVGTIGNIMVTMVIGCSRDMRTSTNYFLINLSIADLLVLLVVTPNALLEVVYNPEIWLLGKLMCKLIPMLELLVCHASVLTILAISFERYYAICSPLKVLYVCTKTRAVWICIIIWIAAGVITSPMILISHYIESDLPSGTMEAKCIIEAGSMYPDIYTTSTIVLFFILPLIILTITYHHISLKLIDRSELPSTNNHKGRNQIILMLKTVVFTFFLLLLPFRLLTLVVLISDYDSEFIRSQYFYIILYFSRVMTYINSALNPILYNVMSSKFRNGFRRLCGCGLRVIRRNGTMTLTNTSIVNNNSPDSFRAVKLGNTYQYLQQQLGKKESHV